MTKWLTRAADVLLGAQRLVGLLRVLAAALAGAALGFPEEPAPAVPVGLAQTCSASCLSSQAQTRCSAPISMSQ